MMGHGTHGQPAGTWSDDTSMALAVCDSYRELGRVDAEDVRVRFVAWYERGQYSVGGVFDVGGTTARALERGRGCAGERDNGNGSLMRTVPLASTDATDDEVRAVSAITHAHKTSTEACVTAVRLARLLAAGSSPLDAAGKVGLAWLACTARDDVKSGGYVVGTLHAAVWCLLRSHDYRACVLEAVNLGDDTDTTAAVAGALAGIVYGERGIPAEWLRALRGKGVIDACLF